MSSYEVHTVRCAPAGAVRSPSPGRWPAPECIIPGHDPLVLERYPAPSKGMQDIVVRLDGFVVT